MSNQRMFPEWLFHRPSTDMSLRVTHSLVSNEWCKWSCLHITIASGFPRLHNKEWHFFKGAMKTHFDLNIVNYINQPGPLMSPKQFWPVKGWTWDLWGYPLVSGTHPLAFWVSKDGTCSRPCSVGLGFVELNGTLGSLSCSWVVFAVRRVIFSSCCQWRMLREYRACLICSNFFAC